MLTQEMEDLHMLIGGQDHHPELQGSLQLENSMADLQERQYIFEQLGFYIINIQLDKGYGIIVDQAYL